jgi:hypothetical protein
VTKKPSGNRANRTSTKPKPAAKPRTPSGRVTPKGTRPAPKGSRAATHSHGAGKRAEASSRYTPPVPTAAKFTPKWVPYAFFGLMALGVIGVFLNYLSVLPGAPSWWWLGGSLACVFGAIMAATQYR